MNIKSFNSFINEEFEEKDFSQKLEEDFDIIDAVKRILNFGLESAVEKLADVTEGEEFTNVLFDSLRVDATDLVEFDLSKEIDICIYSEDVGGTGCPACKWDDLAGHISDNAIIGLTFLAENLIRENFIIDFMDFMKDNNLEYSNVYKYEKFGHAAPSKVIPLENGDVSQYRDLDGSYNVDEYRYENQFFNIELYIKKEV